LQSEEAPPELAGPVPPQGLPPLALLAAVVPEVEPAPPPELALRAPPPLAAVVPEVRTPRRCYNPAQMPKGR